MAETITAEQFAEYLAKTGEKQPAFTADYNVETDGPVTYTVDGNGDLLVECTTSGRFAKYPWPGTAATV
jgi:hypothetical protein